MTSTDLYTAQYITFNVALKQVKPISVPPIKVRNRWILLSPQDIIIPAWNKIRIDTGIGPDYLSGQSYDVNLVPVFQVKELTYNAIFITDIALHNGSICIWLYNMSTIDYHIMYNSPIVEINVQIII
jgi:hypothetical protein